MRDFIQVLVIAVGIGLVWRKPHRRMPRSGKNHAWQLVKKKLPYS
jgi:hypothetical protein